MPANSVGEQGGCPRAHSVYQRCGERLVLLALARPRKRIAEVAAELQARGGPDVLAALLAPYAGSDMLLDQAGQPPRL